MFFTIEPMINLGRPHVKILSDGWTAVTRDRSLSAQFEHTLGVTADGCEVFTLLAGRVGCAALCDARGRRLSVSGTDTAPPPEPHFTGHRERLRERFRRGGSSALNDYEFLELILFRAMPRRDVKPVAKALLRASARSPRCSPPAPSGSTRSPGWARPLLPS